MSFQTCATLICEIGKIFWEMSVFLVTKLVLLPTFFKILKFYFHRRKKLFIFENNNNNNNNNNLGGKYPLSSYINVSFDLNSVIRSD